MDITKNKLQQINTITHNYKSTHKWLAEAFADIKYIYDEKIYNLLIHKKNPAFKAAETVKSIAKEKRELLCELKECRYKINYYEALFPSLEDYIDDYDDKEDKVINTEESVKDETLLYVTKKEYNQLNTVDRNQLALDRYKNRKHSREHIGKMYEQYIGYLYETNGYKVDYFGIKEKLNDLGRDLICSKDDIVHVVQCKNWSKKKEIHENAICQLYGTVAKFKIEYRKNNNTLFWNNVIPAFYTTTKLSNTAVEFATELNVRWSLRPMSFDYPMIKCNIGSYGEKIYHLPFDQQYDRTLINKKGEFYTLTVCEAEKAGFKRAKRWSGTNDT